MAIIGAEYGDIFNYIESYKLNGIMNAANAKGPMGAGIAGAIKRAGGIEIQKDAFRVCQLNDISAGEAYSTISGKLEERGIREIIHAVTMKEPGGITSLDIIERAFNHALQLAMEHRINIIGCTSLGTGVGGLDPIEVANRMVPLAEKYFILVLFVDFNKQFLEEVERLIELKP